MTTSTAPLSQDELKTLVGQAALRYVVPGEIVGVGTGSTVNKFIDALASMKDTNGLLGKITRTEDREAVKPFLFVQAKKGEWAVAHAPK